MTSHRASPTGTSPAEQTSPAQDLAHDAAGTAHDAAQTGQDAAAAGKAVAQTGRDAAADVAGTATDAAKDVAAQTRDEARDLLGRTKSQLTDQVRTQQGSLVETLRSLGEQLGEMTSDVQHQGTAVDLAVQGRDRVNGAADWLDGREPADVLNELRRVGRNRPGVFLLGAVAAGVVAGRLTRGVVQVHTDSSTDPTDDDTTPRTPSTPPVRTTPAHAVTAAPLDDFGSGGSMLR